LDTGWPTAELFDCLIVGYWQNQTIKQPNNPTIIRYGLAARQIKQSNNPTTKLYERSIEKS